MTVINRRKRARIKFQIPARIRHWSGAVCGVRSLDHSLEGVLLRSPQALYPGEVVTVNFCPPQRQSVDVRGVVLRCEEMSHGFKVAVRFHRPHRPLIEFIMLELDLLQARPA